MEALYGKVEKIALNIYSWKLGCKTYANGWRSRSFSIPVYPDFFRFAFQLTDVSPLCQSGKLFLHKLDKKSSVNFYLNITLRYNCETEELSVKNSAISKGNKGENYYLAEIRTSNLLEKTCTFLKIGLSTETVHGTGEPKTYEEQRKGDESNKKGDNIKRNELKEEKGFAILCGDLKNAFLSEEDSDVILRVGDKKYPAHKVIIRNRSSVFRAMLEHDMTEKKEGFVHIEDCDPDIFRDFLLYLYSGKLDNITNVNVFELYYMSDKYDVKQLKMDCVDFIVNHLSIGIICEVIVLSTKHSENDLLKRAIEFFVKNAEDIFVTVQWQEFLIKNPIQANELIIKAFKNDPKRQEPTALK